MATLVAGFIKEELEALMSAAPYFVRPCPTCSRKSRILVDYLGSQVRCQHCGREFEAVDPDSESAAIDDPVQYWINFTDHQLAGIQDGFSRDPGRLPR